MRIWSTVAVVLAGCGDGAVVLDIDVGTTRATEVELVIAEQPCDGCTVQGPPATLPNQVVWTRDSPARTVAPVVGGHAKFHLEAGDQNASPTIVAVGFDGEVARGFVVVPALPITQDGVYTATLGSSTPSSALTGTHLDVWAPGQTVRTGPVCISIPGDRAIVPADDPDCDGFVGANECPGGDYTFHDVQPATVAAIPDASCLGTFPLTGPLGNVGDTCRLGGTGCADGSVSQATRCDPANICLPDGACSCNGIDLPCLQQKLFTSDTAGGGTHDVLIDCVVELDANGLCSGSKVLPVRLPTGLRSCTTSPKFLTLPLQQPLAFTADLAFPASGAMLVPSPADGSCNVDLTVEVAPTMATNTMIDRALIDYHPSNGFDVLIPLRITYRHVTDTCTLNGGSCLVNAQSGNSVLACFADGAMP